MDTCDYQNNIYIEPQLSISVPNLCQLFSFPIAEKMEVTAEQFQNLLKDIISKDSETNRVIESMKILRVSVGKSPDHYQALILSEENAILATCSKIHSIFNESENNSVTVQELCIMWQFLHNLCVNQTAFCANVWHTFQAEILQLLALQDSSKLKDVLSAIILQKLKQDTEFVIESALTSKILRLLLNVTVTDKNAVLQFPILVLQELLRNHSAFLAPSIYDDLDHIQRLAMLDIIAEENVNSLNKNVALFVIAIFKSQANILMTVVKNHEVADPSEVSRILSILGTYSHATTLIPLLQCDKSLLIDAVYLLRMVHDAGKYNPNSMFASIKDMNEIADKEKMENDPVFGFKRDLIRLVGNMCHKHKSNQDQVRLLASNK